MSHPLMQERHLHYYKRLKALQEAQDTRARNIYLRRKWLDSQKRSNYQNEYDRVRNALEHTATGGASKITMQARLKKLEELGAQAVSGIR